MFAVTKKCKKPQVRTCKKSQNLAGPRSRKNAKSSYVSSHVKTLKTRMSAVIKISLKCFRSVVIKNPKNFYIRVHRKMRKTCRSTITEKYRKLAGPRSQTNAKKLMSVVM